MAYRALVPLPLLLWGTFALHEGMRGSPYDAALLDPGPRAGAPTIRVGLSAHLAAASVPVAVAGPFRVTDETGGEALLDRSPDGSRLEPCAAEPRARGIAVGRLFFERDVVRIRPLRPGTLQVGTRTYAGDLLLILHDGKLNAVNEAGVEEYVAGVLPREMSLDSFPAPALRAQAIAARTYALFELRTGVVRERTVGFDVYDDDRSQVYGGITAVDAEARRIAGETAGIVATWRGRVFKAYFHSTCGGRTVPSWDVFHDTKMAPLAGTDCGACGDSPFYRWSAAFGKDEVRARLPDGLDFRGKVRSVRVVSTIPKSDYAAEIEIGGERGLKVRIDAPAFRLALLRGEPAASAESAEGRRAQSDKRRSILSLCFTVKDAGASIVLEGRGWGHGVGLCQTGARGLARAGASAEAILQHYYPGGEIVRVY